MEKVQKFSDDRSLLNGFLLGQLLLATAVGLMVTVISNVIGLINQGSVGLTIFANPGAFMRRDLSEKINILLGTASSFLMVIGTWIAFTIAYRAYVIWRRVETIEQVRKSVEEQQTELRGSLSK